MAMTRVTSVALAASLVAASVFCAPIAALAAPSAAMEISAESAALAAPAESAALEALFETARPEGASSVTLALNVGKPGLTYREAGVSAAELSSGSSGGAAGSLFDCPAPFVGADGVLYVPFRAPAEALGAYVKYADPASPDLWPQLICEFMGSEFSVSVDDGFAGRDAAKAAVASKDGAAAPQNWKATLVGGAAYVSSEAFDFCAGTVTLFDPSTGSVTVTLANDGEIRSLSSLLGEIAERRIGNSYFGWSADAPRKSVLVETSFNGGEAIVYCMSKYATMSVSVEPGDGMTLDRLYESQYNDSGYSDQGEIVESKIVEPAQSGVAGARFIEALVNRYDSIGLRRVFARSGYVYVFEITAYSDPNDLYTQAPDASVFDEGSELRKLADSFKLGAFDSGSRTLDISKENAGVAEYVRYLDVPGSDSLPRGWSVNVMPDWFLNRADSDGDFMTELGRGDVSLRVSLNSQGGAGAQDAQGGAVSDKAAAEAYLERFPEALNKDAVKNLESRLVEQTGGFAAEFSYELDMGAAKTTSVDRRFFVDGVVYDVSLSAPIRRFASNKDRYMAVLDSFAVGEADAMTVRDYAARLAADQAKLRLSKEDDAAVRAQGEGYYSRLPGSWLRVTESDAGFLEYEFDMSEFYVDAATGALIAANMVFDGDMPYFDIYADDEKKDFDATLESIACASLAAIFGDAVDYEELPDASLYEEEVELSWTKSGLKGADAASGSVRRVLKATRSDKTVIEGVWANVSAYLVVIGEGDCDAVEDINKFYAIISITPEMFATDDLLSVIDGFAANIAPTRTVSGSGGAGDMGDIESVGDSGNTSGAGDLGDIGDLGELGDSGESDGADGAGGADGRGVEDDGAGAVG